MTHGAALNSVTMLLRVGLLALSLIPGALTPDWTMFHDPLEKAFTIDVPQGWTVKGGLFRLGYSDYRPMVDLQSPDGQISIRLGDVSIPTYSVPNQFHPEEGSVLDLGAQIQMTVARYRSGREFAALYARARFSGTCQALVPQAVAAAPPVPDQPEEAAVKQSSGGQVAYSCDGGRTAYAYAKTALYPAFWQVHSLASFVAPSDQVPSARAIVEHCAKSFKLADGWIQYQKKLDQEALQYQKRRQQGRVHALSQQVAQFAMQMQAMRNQGVHDRKVRAVSEAGLPLFFFRHNMPKERGGGDGGGFNGSQGCGALGRAAGSATCNAAGLGVRALDEVHQERLRLRRQRCGPARPVLQRDLGTGRANTLALGQRGATRRRPRTD